MSNQSYGDPSRERETSLESSFRRDPLGTYVWAFIFIWAGVVFLLDIAGLLKNLPLMLPAGMFPLINTTWTLIFLGAALIVAVSIILRLVIPSYPRPLFGSYLFAAIILGLALGSLFGFGAIWPVVLIGLGIVIFFRNFFRKDGEAR